MPGFLAACDEAVAKECWKIFTKQGLDIQLGVKIGEVSRNAKGISVPYVDAKGEQQTLVVDKLIVSVGRIPNTDSLGLETIGLAPNERGFIEVDDHCRTAQPGVFAIGGYSGPGNVIGALCARAVVALACDSNPEPAHELVGAPR